MPAATVVIVPATTLWVDPTSPRGLDAPAVAAHPDVLAWLAGLDADEDGRIGLHGRVGSQLVLGEPVEVVGAEGDWRQVVCPWQPSSADPRGYPGWVPAAHLGQATSDPADAADVGVVAPTPHGQVSGQALVAQARLHLGLAYLWGGMSPYGLDCSGLVHLSLRSLGLLVPRDAHDQQDASTPVEVDAVRPGDLLFFARDGQPAHHVGIATGEGRMLHAPETGAVIVEEPLTPERLQTLSGAGRFTAEADEPVTSRVPAPLLVLAAIVSVQFGGALAATLVPRVGAAGSVALRLVLAAAVLLAVARPRLRGRTRADWLTVCAFALVLGLMNLAFYSSLALLPLGVAVTIEFVGPLVLATVLSRRLRDLVAVAGAALGVVLISGALTVPWDELEVRGILLALAAGACWAAYILLSARTGTRFAQLDGLAIAMAIAALVVAPWGWPPPAAPCSAGTPSGGAPASRCCPRCCRTRWS